MKLFYLLLLFCVTNAIGQVGIGTTNPNLSSALDISSTTQGMLPPRMTTAQRNIIPSPANGLLIFNITTNTVDIFSPGGWRSLIVNNAANSNVVYVYSLADLPAPISAVITLIPTKVYIFSGIVDISPNYLVLNGAGLKGTDPSKDGVMSNVAGAVLRSSGVSVFMENFAVVPLSSGTQAYDFTGTQSHFCNLFSGNSVTEVGPASGGVGQINGFRAITILKNYWKCTNGVKIGGTVGKLTSSFNFISDMQGVNAIGIEILANANILDIDLANNYFENITAGVKVNTPVTIDRGRMTTNMFRGVTNLLVGFDSFTREWEMIQNTNVPNSRATAYISMDGNAPPAQGATATDMAIAATFYKIAGTTVPVSPTSLKRFTTTSNRLTYTGKDPITAKVRASIGAKSPAVDSDYSIRIFKNGVAVGPITSNATAGNNETFQISLTMEVEMASNDFIEVFIRRNSGNVTSLFVDNLQFQVTD